MRARVAVAAALLLAAATQAAAQDDLRLRLAQEYVDLPAVQAMLDQSMSPAAVMAQMAAVMPPEVAASPAELRRVSEIVAEELATLRPALTAATLDGAARWFSVEELEALIAFNSSPEGAAVMAKMQPYMAEVFGMVGPEIQEAMRRIAGRIERELGAP